MVNVDLVAGLAVFIASFVCVVWCFFFFLTGVHYIVISTFSKTAMAKDQVLQLLQSLQLPSHKYVVLMGASLCVHGIRNSGDIDILIDSSLCKELISVGFTETLVVTERGIAKRFALGEIEAFDYFLNVGTFSDFCASFETIEMFDGIPFVSLHDAMFIKQLFGREKDLHDLSLISSHLSKKAYHFSYFHTYCLY